MAAANVAAHFILNNVFLAAWILLWTRNQFWGAEIILIAHFINQTVTYFRHSGLPAFVHLPAVAGPYAWTLTALFWNGAIAVHSHNLPGRIVANIFIWVILAIGLFSIVPREDYILGYCLSWLTLCKFFFLLSFLKRFADIYNSSTRPQTSRYQDHCPAVDLFLYHLCRVLVCLSLPLHDEVHWPRQPLPSRCPPRIIRPGESATAQRGGVSGVIMASTKDLLP